MDHIENYEVNEADSLGSGAFADVFRARQISTNRTVALKVGRNSEEARCRLRREIDAQRALAHANVLPIIDYDREGYSWFVTDVAEGDIGKIRDRKPLNEREVLRLMEEILGALAHAHRRGFVHRDLSPGNILRLHGRWVLADWGYVTDGHGAGRLTHTGTGGGTFTWAAPEVLQNAHHVDGRADLYALGKLVSWLLTGVLPEIGKDPNLPEAGHWRTFLGKLAVEDPKERFQTPEEALGGLGDIASALISASPTETGVCEDPIFRDSVAPTVAALKRYLVNDAHRIRLDELMTQETKRVMDAVTSERFTRRSETGDGLITRIEDYYAACKPLMELLFVGGYYDRESRELWKKAVQRLADTFEPSGSTMTIVELKRLPALLAMNAVAFGAISGGNYRTVGAVTEGTQWREGGVSAALVQRASTEQTLSDALKNTARFQRAKTPGSVLMFEYLRNVSRDAFASEREYEEAFTRFEIIMALVTVHNGGWATGRFAWLGGGWRDAEQRDAFASVLREMNDPLRPWGPVQGGLFGGDLEKAKAAATGVAQIANTVNRRG